MADVPVAIWLLPRRNKRTPFGIADSDVRFSSAMVNTGDVLFCPTERWLLNTPTSSCALDGIDTAPSDAARLAADARAAAFGRIIALLMASPRHAGMTLGETQAFVAPAIAHGQLAILGKHVEGSGVSELAAAAWWAMVSPEVDERLTQSRDKLMTLGAADWRSGDQPWIVETIGEADLINELIKRLAERTFTGKPAKLRAHLPDGRTVVGRVERKVSDGLQTKT